MPEIGLPELLIIGLIVLLIFGPSRATEVGGGLGRAIRRFRQEVRDEGGKERARPGGDGNSSAPPSGLL